MVARKYSFLKKPVVYHSIFWVLYFILNMVRWGSYFDDYGYSFRSNLVEFPLHIILVYFNLYYLMPRLIPKRVGTYVASLFSATMIISLVRIILTYLLVTTDIYRESSNEETLFGINYVAATFIGELYVVGVVTSIKLTMDWIRYKNRTSELEKANLETELAFLKSQIQPHFFFNTLNNLYSLTLDKSDKAPSTVLKLSELMSYVIYDAKQKSVPVINEIKHIQNYLDLEKLRYGNRLQVDFDVSGNIEGKKIPPVLLLPFVENSFKHGVKSRKEKIPIHLSLTVSNGNLTFTTENEINEMPESNSQIVNTNHKGIGLSNTERRLSLLFENNFDLSIDESDDKYKLMLKIPVE